MWILIRIILLVSTSSSCWHCIVLRAFFFSNFQWSNAFSLGNNAYIYWWFVINNVLRAFFLHKFVLIWSYALSLWSNVFLIGLLLTRESESTLNSWNVAKNGFVSYSDPRTNVHRPLSSGVRAFQLHLSLAAWQTFLFLICYWYN